MQRPTIIAIGLIFLACILAVGGAFLFLNPQTPVISAQNSTIHNTENHCGNWPEPKLYTYGNKTISYECPPKEILTFGDQYTNVYVSDGIAKTDIIDGFPAYLPNTDVEFKKTSKPNIILLNVGSGDLGGYSHSYYYINMDTEKVLEVDGNNSENTLTIKDTGNKISKIGLLIENNCEKNNVAILRDITVNSLTQSIIKQPQSLSCTSGFGGGPNIYPSIELKYSSPNKDLSKVFFSINGNNYSFDIKNELIIKEDPLDKL